MISENANIEFEVFMKYIRRAFWRFQYKVRKQINTEIFILQDNASTENIETNIISMLSVKNILDKISSEKAKYIIVRTILQGASEKQVARELRISQQAVNKCKTKTIKNLKMIIKTLV